MRARGQMRGFALQTCRQVKESHYSGMAQFTKLMIKIEEHKKSSASCGVRGSKAVRDDCRMDNGSREPRTSCSLGRQRDAVVESVHWAKFHSEAVFRSLRSRELGSARVASMTCSISSVRT